MNAIIFLVVTLVASGLSKPVSESALSTATSTHDAHTSAAALSPNHLPQYDEDGDDDPAADLLDPSEDTDVLEDELGAAEDMEGSESVVFRPLFAHRKREARRQAYRQRRARASERGSSFVPYRRAYRRFRPRPEYLHPRQDPPLQILY